MDILYIVKYNIYIYINNNTLYMIYDTLHNICVYIYIYTQNIILNININYHILHIICYIYITNIMYYMLNIKYYNVKQYNLI